MYCPQCATLNTDGARFCRSCGMELEAVALALGEWSAQPTEGSVTKLKTSEDWMEKRSAAVKGISRGVSLLIVSVLIAIAMAIFVPANVPWIIVWAVLVGWMAMWGAIEIGNGIPDVIEAKSRLRLHELANKELADETVARRLSSAGQSPAVRTTSGMVNSSPSSVTEGTTRHLNDPAEK